MCTAILHSSNACHLGRVEQVGGLQFATGSKSEVAFRMPCARCAHNLPFTAFANTRTFTWKNPGTDLQERYALNKTSMNH